MAASRSRIMRAAPRGIEKHSRAGIYARGGRHRWAANLKMTTQMKSFATFRLMLNLLSKPYALIKHAALCFYQSSFRADKAPADKARGFMYMLKSKIRSPARGTPANIGEHTRYTQSGRLKIKPLSEIKNL